MIKNQTEARLAQGYRASPHYTYEKLLESTTMLNPNRKTYLSTRKLNDIQGTSIRR